MKLIRVFAVLTFALVPLASIAQTHERIISYDIEIVTNSDASLNITETIHVYAAGDAIERGIYREFPSGGQELLSVTRDGRPEDHHWQGNTLYLGNAAVFLNEGEYTYEIAYRVRFAVEFFDDLDQVYWNAIGTQWAFPIEAASVVLRLPSDFDADEMIVEAFTGSEGATGSSVEFDVPQPGVVSLRTISRLNPYQGFTIKVRFPKGHVVEPTRADRVNAAVDDIRPILGFTGYEAPGLIVLLIYYVGAWTMVGRDPAAGRRVPTERPPEGFSPAACRYIKQMGFDNTTLVSCLLNMAIKGYLRIEQDDDDDYVVVRDAADASVLEPEEAAIGDALFSSRGEVTFSQSNRSTIQSAITDCTSSLSARFGTGYFNTNGKFVFFGFLITIALLVVLQIFGNNNLDDPDAPEYFLVGFITIFIFAISTIWWSIAFGAFESLIGMFRPNSGESMGKVLGGCLMMMILGLFVAMVQVFAVLIANAAYGLTAFFACGLHGIFMGLLKAPTMKGREALDRIESFAMYLNGDSVSAFFDENEETREQRYEQFLPYATALGLEGGWTEEFESSLSRSATTPHESRTHYRPHWYRSSSGTSTMGALTTGAFVASLSSSLSSAVASSSSSGSSSSGGSSGGGGGGGGGGGW